MASAAAVGANAALSPIHNSLGDDEGRVGAVTSAIGSREDDAAIENGDVAEQDEDDDIRGTARRKGPVEAAAVGDQDGQEDGEQEGGGDDLFGEDEEEGPVEEEAMATRQLDDEELDSGDDMERRDRVEDMQQSQEQDLVSQEKIMMGVEMPRQPMPEPSDGEMYLLKVPDFMAIDPHAYSHTSFAPPTTDHHSNKPPSAAFSAYNTSISTIRWRHSPSDPKQLQSNARVLRWSDGSLTLQLASQPTVQYEMDGKPLAPPQRNPVKPTPVSVSVPGEKGGRQGDGTIAGERYEQGRDALTYLVTPSEATSMARNTHKITAGLTIKQNEDVTDEAIEKLQAALASAANAKKVRGTTELQLIDEDPERKRKEAEIAVRQATARDKKAKAAAEREQERGARVLGRGSGRQGGGGLNASMLEDDELGGSGGGRSRKPGNTPRKQRQRRNSIYSEDEDFGRKRFATKEDEYDEEDDFLAPSDEEEAVDDDEDPDDGIMEQPGREKTPKRDRPSPAGRGEDADAEGEEDDDAPQARTKRRRIVDEDEDEE